MLRPQDILVLLTVLVWDGAWTFDQVAHALGLSASAVHRSLERAAVAGLYRPAKREVDRPALEEFIVHGLRYVFPARWGGEARGLPTAWAASPLADELAQSGNVPPVWPYPRGPVRGIALEPLDPRAPDAAVKDDRLGELLTLVDAIRIGAARERALAAEKLKARLRQPGIGR